MPEYSYWIIAGLLLIIGEFVISGLVTVFLGLAALIVGALAYFQLLLDPAWQIGLFALLSLLLLVGVRRYLRDRLLGRENRDESADDSAGLIGQRATVAGEFSDGVGRVSYRGALWQAQSGQTLRDGQMVRIVRHDGLWLTVEPWGDPSSDN